MPGLLTFIGSGETAAGMVKVHRALLQALGEPPQPAFLDTPAGFELGLEAIHARFQEYFKRSLGLDLAVSSFRRRDQEPERTAAALQVLGQSNYLLAGPGSPSYAIRHWRASAPFDLLVQRWLAGAQLVFASAAAITLGRHALPVYEIYKVGEDPHWIEGMDLLGRFGYELAIVPHWDNAEGGTHDTRACFMGMSRFERLHALLPPTAVVLGVDEHTACTLDLDAGLGHIRGRGGVTVLRGQQRLRFTHGEQFPMETLQPPSGDGTLRREDASPVGPTGDLARAAALLAAGDLPRGLRELAALAEPELAALLHQAASAAASMAPPQDQLAPFVELMLDVRTALREARQWELADRIRQGLGALGVEVQDTPQGSRWTLTRPQASRGE